MEDAYQHGKPASWALISVTIAAFVAGGTAIIAEIWWLFWASAGIVLVSIPVGRFIRSMDEAILREERQNKATPSTAGSRPG